MTQRISISLLGVLALLTGCQTQAIQSDSVRQLIAFEGQKITAANTAVDSVCNSTPDRVKNLRAAVDDLNKDMEQLNQIEAIHSLIFSSNQNVATKTGRDAQAVGYLVAKIYLTDDGGLSKTVQDQFDSDYSSLQAMSDQLKKSWQGISSNQQQIANYANQSGFGSVDVDLMKTILDQIPGAPAEFGNIVAKSDQVNADLQKALNSGIVPQNATIQKTQSFVGDLDDLLDRIKK